MVCVSAAATYLLTYLPTHLLTYTYPLTDSDMACISAVATSCSRLASTATLIQRLRAAANSSQLAAVIQLELVAEQISTACASVTASVTGSELMPGDAATAAQISTQTTSLQVSHLVAHLVTHTCRAYVPRTLSPTLSPPSFSRPPARSSALRPPPSHPSTHSLSTAGSKTSDIRRVYPPLLYHPPPTH